MSRFYALSIVNAQTGLPIRGADNQPFGPFTSLFPANNPARPFSGPTNPGALRILFDIPVVSADTPAGAATITVWGVPLTVIYQVAKFNPSQDFSSFCYLSLQAGMAPGLPLATAAFNDGQAGLICAGSILQAIGNWEGTDQRLEFVVVPTTAKPLIGSLGTLADPKNVIFQWSPGQTLADAVTRTLTTAWPGIKVTVDGNGLNPALTLPVPYAVQHGTYDTLETFAQQVNAMSLSIVNGSGKGPNGYQGVKIVATQTGFKLYDGTRTVEPGVNVSVSEPSKQIKFQDLIGQPTWLNPATLSIKTMLRADLQVGSYFTMPTFKTSSGQNVPIPTATTASSWSQYREKSAITGTFQVTALRHLGDSRQPSGDSWVTVIEANAQTPQPQPSAG